MRASAERVRRIESVDTLPGHRLRLRWLPGPEAEIDFGPFLKRRACRALADELEFRAVRVGDWGHSLEWPSGTEIGADSLWLETLTATGRKDARAFLNWRYRHGLSLSGTAEALDLSRRTVAYYCGGENPVPKRVLLACLGWEVASDRARADPTVETDVRELMSAHRRERT